MPCNSTPKPNNRTRLCLTLRLKPMKCFRMRGKKSTPHPLSDDPPRVRANAQRGHGTFAHDRPAIVGTVGRFSGQVRLRVVKHTDQATLHQHMQTFTLAQATANTDEWRSYQGIPQRHVVVCHGQHEWARDDDGDGVREVHINTAEGMWTSVRNFLRPFRGVHKRYLSGYVAISEFAINDKRVLPKLIHAITAQHFF